MCSCPTIRFQKSVINFLILWMHEFNAKSHRLLYKLFFLLTSFNINHNINVSAIDIYVSKESILCQHNFIYHLSVDTEVICIRKYYQLNTSYFNC